MRRVHRQRQKKYSPGMTYRRLTHPRKLPQKNKIIQKNLAGNNAGNANGKGENSFGKKNSAKKYDGGSYGGYKKSDNPDVLYGKDFEDETIPIEKIVGEMGEVTIRCQVMTLETREIRNEKTIVIMSVTDFTDSIVLKNFTRNDQLPELA